MCGRAQLSGTAREADEGDKRGDQAKQEPRSLYVLADESKEKGGMSVEASKERSRRKQLAHERETATTRAQTQTTTKTNKPPPQYANGEKGNVWRKR